MRSIILSRLLLCLILAFASAPAVVEAAENHSSGALKPTDIVYPPITETIASHPPELQPVPTPTAPPTEKRPTQESPNGLMDDQSKTTTAAGSSRGAEAPSAPVITADESGFLGRKSSASAQSLDDATADSTNLDAESVTERATRFDADGTTIFHEGTIQIAMGITNLAISERDRTANGESDDANQLKNQGLQQIAEGQQNVSRGHDMVSQANTIGQREANLKTASASGSSTFKPHQLAFDENRVSDDGKKALEDMESEAGIPASSLIAAVNQGRSEGIVNLAAGAHGVDMSQAQIMAALPSFATGGSPVAVPSSTPKFSTLAGNSPKSGAELSGGVANKLLAKRGLEKRTAALAQNTNVRRPAVASESLEPLGHEQLLGSLGRKVASADDDSTLFHRVKRQYGKRFHDLAVAKATSAQ